MEHIISDLLRQYEHGRVTRRQLIRTLAIAATATATGKTVEAAPANAVSINHVSMQVADYTKTRDFYAGLFGMTVSDDDGKTQCRLTFGDNILIPRNASRMACDTMKRFTCVSIDSSAAGSFTASK